MPTVPRCMSTQHPDNASVPFFATSGVLAGEDEIREAFYAYSHLGCDEQMWDVEGKEIDTYVVKKLLSLYEEYFRDHVLGEDLRLTLRVPNPDRRDDRGQGPARDPGEHPPVLRRRTALLRPRRRPDLRGHPADDDLGGVHRPHLSLLRRLHHRPAAHRFRDGRHHDRRVDRRVLPPRIRSSRCSRTCRPCCGAADIVEEYLADKDVSRPAGVPGAFRHGDELRPRVGRAREQDRSRPARRAVRSVAACASTRSWAWARRRSAAGFRPATAERVGAEYPSVVTFTIQSAFKYDYPPDEVRAACEHLKARRIGPARRPSTSSAPRRSSSATATPIGGAWSSWRRTSTAWPSYVPLAAPASCTSGCSATRVSSAG